MPNVKVITMSCSFCRKSQEECRKIVAGPQVCICDECICNSIQCFIKGEAESDQTKEPCSFCGKRSSFDNQMYTSSSHNICQECIMLCIEICLEPLSNIEIEN